MSRKNKYISFIDKRITLAMSLVWFVISVLMICFSVTNWSDLWKEDPLIAVLVPIAGVIVFVASILMPLSGMMITKKGNIVFLPDFRLKIFKTEDMKRIALNFNECKNKKYAVTVKMIPKNGNVFKVDYSVHFRNRIKGEKLAMAMYTISKKKVDSIVAKTADLDVFSITIIDQNQEIVYQSLPTDLY